MGQVLPSWSGHRLIAVVAGLALVGSAFVAGVASVGSAAAERGGSADDWEIYEGPFGYASGRLVTRGPIEGHPGNRHGAYFDVDDTDDGFVADLVDWRCAAGEDPLAGECDTLRHVVVYTTPTDYRTIVREGLDAMRVRGSGEVVDDAGQSVGRLRFNLMMRGDGKLERYEAFEAAYFDLTKQTHFLVENRYGATVEGRIGWIVADPSQGDLDREHSFCAEWTYIRPRPDDVGVAGGRSGEGTACSR